MSILHFTPHAVGQPQERFPFAQVVAPAPSSPTDPLHVVMPEWSDVHVITIKHFPMLYGGALPTVGTACLLAHVNSDFAPYSPVCLWWDGVYVPDE